MLEIVFDDSTKASLSQRFGSERVVAIGFNLDIGPIQDALGPKRQEVFRELYRHIAFTEKEIADFFDNQKHDYERLVKAAASGESIRIWVSSTPASRCGLAFICYLLKGYEISISQLELPRYIDKREYLVSHHKWAEVAVHELDDLLVHETQLSKWMRQLMAEKWVQLKDENAELRAIVNTHLMSVPPDFYDFLIIKHVPDHPFTVAWLIGTVLGNEIPTISDSWCALRIQHLIKTGFLEVVEENRAASPEDNPYADVLRKNKDNA